MSYLPASLVCGLTMALAIGVTVLGQQPCPRFDGHGTEVLVCRGALSTGGYLTPLVSDVDLSFRFRASPVPAGPDGAGLAHGACG